MDVHVCHPVGLISVKEDSWPQPDLFDPTIECTCKISYSAPGLTDL